MKFKIFILVIIFNMVFVFYGANNFTFSKVSTKSQISRLKKNQIKILKTLISGKKYIAKENKKLLKKIIIGEWDADVWGLIKIKKNGTYERTYYDDLYDKKRYYKGIWILVDNILSLKQNRTKYFKKYRIKYFLLTSVSGDKDPLGRAGYQYAFEVIFDENKYKDELSQFYIQF